MPGGGHSDVDTFDRRALVTQLVVRRRITVAVPARKTAVKTARITQCPAVPWLNASPYWASSVGPLPVRVVGEQRREAEVVSERFERPAGEHDDADGAAADVHRRHRQHGPGEEHGGEAQHRQGERGLGGIGDGG